MIINGIRWIVRLVTPSHPMLLTPRNTHALGACDKATQTIYIDETLKPAQVKQILCHEIVHAIVFSYGYTLSYHEEEDLAEFITKYGEEILHLTHFIYDGIRMK